MSQLSAINFHLTESCNMRCRFCFAKYADNAMLSLKEAHSIIDEISFAGIRKINFAGGEPMLFPGYSALLEHAKANGLVVGMITNGSLLSMRWIEQNAIHLDWLGLSVDSLNEFTNLSAGRAVSGRKTINKAKYLELSQAIKQMGLLLKINTVVHRLNAEEDMSEFILDANPDRWKIFQMLPISGSNDEAKDLLITPKEFQTYLDRHQSVQMVIPTYPETNDAMKGSYLMVDPTGKLYSNERGYLRYSEPIPRVGLQIALNQIHYDHAKFMKRGGIDAIRTAKV